MAARCRTRNCSINLNPFWRRKGHLSLKIMLAAKSVPNPTLYTRRFGSLTGAYKRIGFKPESRYNFTEHIAKIDGVVCSVAADIIAAIEKRGRGTTFLHELYLLTLSRNFTVSLTMAWHVANGKTEHDARNQTQHLKRRCSGLFFAADDKSAAQMSTRQNCYLKPHIR